MGKHMSPEESYLQKILYYELIGKDIIYNYHKKHKKDCYLKNAPSLDLLKQWKSMKPITIEQKKVQVNFD